MTASISITAFEYGNFFIQSSPYGYTVAESYYNRHGDFEPFYHTNRYTGEILRFTSIKTAIEYCDAQQGA